MEQLVTITLFEKPYDFKVESDVKKAQEVADYLAQEVARVERSQPGKTSEVAKVAVLISAALNIANEHIQLKRDHAKLLQYISDRSANLIRSMDATLQ